MKQSIFTFALLSFLLTLAACQPTQKKNEVYTPEKTMPMELKTFETIKLLTPDTQGGDALMATMQNRKSDREYLSVNLSHKHLSEILWAANGINRPESGKRTVPSAMAMYPLSTYAVLSNGIYLYNPEKHELQPIVEGDYRELAGIQPFVKDAPLNLVFIADYRKYTEGERTLPADYHLYMAALDAGHCTQNVYLYCASEGLKTVVRGRAQNEELLKLLGLEENYQFIVAQTVGY